MTGDQERDPLALARAVHGARLVLLFEELEVVVVWNGSETFNVLSATDGSPLDVFSSAGPVTDGEARDLVARHMEGWDD